MITAEEARRLGWRWVSSFGTKVRPRLHSFDLGWVITPDSTDGASRPIGEGRAVLDRETGEITVWPSLPIDEVIGLFREHRPRKPAARTWSALTRAHRDAARLPYPETETRLELEDQVFVARSAKGRGDLNLHPIVAAFFRTMPVVYRERGAERASEVIALSDALLAEDDARTAAGQPLLMPDEIRTEFFGRAGLSTRRVAEENDPVNGQERTPSLSSMLLMRFLGLRLTVPAGAPVDGGTP